MIWLGMIAGLVLAAIVFTLALCRAAAIGDQVHIEPDEPARPGDQLDLWLRLDGLTAAVDTAITELAGGQVADAQITLGEAANIERDARVEDSLHLMADLAATPGEEAA